MVRSRLDECLAVRPRNEHAGADLEVDRPEGTAAKDIGDRFMRQTPLDEFVKGGRRLSADRIKEHKLALDAQGFRHQ